MLSDVIREQVKGMNKFQRLKKSSGKNVDMQPYGRCWWCFKEGPEGSRDSRRVNMLRQYILWSIQNTQVVGGGKQVR